MAIDGRGRPTKAQQQQASAIEYWLSNIAAYDRDFEKWQSRSEKILKRYRDENRLANDSGARFDILWSNVQTLIPAVFARVPKPEVARRFRDNDPVARVSSLLLERGLEYEVGHYPDYNATMKQCVFDRFLCGRGTAWARYEPHIRAAATHEPLEGEEVTEDAEEPNEELDYECAPVDYVHWRDFGHTSARTWEEVTAVWRRVFMTRDACVERFGEELGKRIPLDTRPDDEKEKTPTTPQSGQNEQAYRACVYEIWDKEKLRAIWISKSMKEKLDEKDDPLGLEGFFPCPKPLYATLTNESLIPVPDFTLYQDQARSLDVLAERIDGLIQAVQVKGVYDSSIPALARLFTEGQNGTLIPVNNWAAFAEKNGLAGAMDIVDLKPIYEALKACFEAAQGLLKQIYDLTGLADIVRGQSEANETATAQRIKGQYASLRLKSMQTHVAEFAGEVLKLKAQIICSKFAKKTILTIAGAQELSQADQVLIPQALELLVGSERMRDDAAEPGPNPLRDFRIEVNSDTMIQIDEQQEKENRIEFITAQGTFMEKALPLAQAAPQLLPLIGALWKFSVQAFKVGKTLEGEFDAVIDKMKEAAAQPQAQKPDPEMAKVQAQQQADQARLQADAQQAQQDTMQREREMQTEAAMRAREQQMQAAIEQHRNEMEAQRTAQQSFMDAQFDRWKAMLDARTKIEVAEIAAKATMNAQQESAARAGAQ